MGEPRSRSKGGEGRDQWLMAGQTLLKRGGAAAVKLHALSAETGLTTGSFYHHYNGMSDYLDQLARHYGTGQLEYAAPLLDDPDPLVRLLKAYHLTIDSDLQGLDAAMRDWAGSNPVAAEAVRLADEAVLEFLVEALEELGHSQVEARLRAIVMFSCVVARIQPPWPVPAQAPEWLLALVVPVPS